MVEKNILWFFLLFLIFYSKYYKYILSVYVFVYAWFSGNNFQCSPEFKFVEFKFVFDIRITHTMHREREEEGGDRYCFLFKYITMFAVYLYDIIL